MNIDWSTMEGYREDMSAEEKLALLDSYEPPAQTESAPEPGAETEVAADSRSAETEPAGKPAPAPAAKNAAKPTKLTPQEAAWKRERDKLTTENGNLRKEMRKYMSEQQAKEAERQAEAEAREAERLAEIEAKDEELKTLRREKTVGSHQTRFMGLGSYSEALAKEAAEAFADGDAETFFKVMKQRDEIFEKSLKSKYLAETPKPPASDVQTEDAKKQDQANLRRIFGLPAIPTK